MKYKFKQALKKLSDDKAIEIVAKLQAAIKEQDRLWAELNKHIPLDDGYVWGSDYAGNIRPWATALTNEIIDRREQEKKNND